MRKIRTLNEKGETEVNTEFMKSEIHFGICLMKEADISRQVIAQATNELIEKCEVISVKFEETNAELANKTTAHGKQG